MIDSKHEIIRVAACIIDLSHSLSFTGSYRTYFLLIETGKTPMNSGSNFWDYLEKWAKTSDNKNYRTSLLFNFN